MRTNPYFVLLEEFFHCEQIILGKFGFAIDRNGNWSGMLGLDLTDELKAKNKAATVLGMKPFAEAEIQPNYNNLKNEAKTAETDYNYSGEIKYNSYGVYKSNRFMFHKPQNQK